MKITFDSNTCKDWVTRGVPGVFVSFVEKGCEGLKLEVRELLSDELAQTLDDTNTEITEQEGVRICLHTKDQEILDESRITRAAGKWIFTSKKVVGRCGCGSSFRFTAKPAPTSELELAGCKILRAGETHTLTGGVYFIDKGASDTDDVIDAGTQATEIEVHEGQSELYIFARTSHKFNIRVTERKATLKLGILVIGDSQEVLDISSLAQISADDAQVSMEVLVFALSGADISVKALGDVPSGVQDYHISVREANVFLSHTGKIRGIPGLNIQSNNGSASHSATFEQFGVMEKFYFESRGLTERQTEFLLIQSRTARVLSGLPANFRDGLARSLVKELHSKK